MAGRKCTLCTHPKVGQINKALAEGVSFRNILERFDVTLGATHRHSDKCLKLDLQAVQEAKKEAQAFDFATELHSLYDRASKMVRALERWLSDPDNEGEFNIDPRDSEITVVYLDHGDLNKQTWQPRLKKAPLRELLKQIQQFDKAPEKEPIQVISAAMDNRKLYLEAFKTLNDRLEQMAKFYGLYTEKKELTVKHTRVVEPDPLEAEIVE